MPDMIRFSSATFLHNFTINMFSNLKKEIENVFQNGQEFLSKIDSVKIVSEKNVGKMMFVSIMLQ